MPTTTARPFPRAAALAAAAAATVASVAAPLAAQDEVVLPRRTTALRGETPVLFAVGKEEGASHELLSNVTSVAFDRQDNLYILDAGNHRVLVFDRVGRFVRQIGKQGQGPGEITFATGLAVLADGRIAVADLGRGGLSIFGADGAYLQHIALGDATGMPGAGGFQASPRGGVIARVVPVVLATPGSGPPQIPREGFIQHHPLTEGAAIRTLATYELPAARVSQQGGGGNVSVRVSMSPPAFAPQMSFGVLPDGGVALTNAAEYAVQIVDVDGRPRRVIRRDEAPRRVTRADQDAAREQRRRQLQGRGTDGVMVRSVNGQRTYSFGGGGILSPEQIEQELRNMTFAEVMPLVQGIATDPLGRIWIERTPSRPGEGTGPIDLVTADGRYIGTVTGLARPSAVSADGTRAAFIDRDAFDVERVIVRGLPREWR
jgi:hypothetical protein